MTSDLIGPKYYAHPYYSSEAYKEKLAAAMAMENARQALQRGESTQETMAYARFLSAVENDATLSHGAFKPFKNDDEEVVRNWPFLASAIREQRP